MKATRGCYLVAEASSAGRQLRLSRSCSQLLMPTTSTSRRATSNTRFARLPALFQRNLCLDSRRKLVSLRATEESRQQASAGVGEGEEAEVEELVGVRLVRDKETGRPYVEYLVKWQDEYEDSWEAADDLSEDLLRGYEDKWWKAVKTGDYDTIVGMLIGGREALVSGVDDERRSALHYSCGTGNVKCAKLLLVNGAEVDLRDKDGYTPLHIASGYMHKPIVLELIEAGADPEIEDNNDRSPLQLVETLRDNLPPNNPTVFSRRLQLNEVIKLLEDNLYEEVTPRNILKARKKAQKKGGEEGGEKKKDAVEAGLFGDGDEEEEEEEMMSVSDLDKREFLVQWGEEDIEPSWVPLKHMADDVVEDFDQGLEYAEALRILEKREEVVEAVEANLDADTSSSSAATAASEEEGEGEGEGEGEKEGEKAVQTKVEYLIEWSDGYENSWEPEGHVSDDLVKLFEQQGEPARQVSSVTS